MNLYNREITVLEAVNSTNKLMCKMSRKFSVHISDTQLTHQIFMESPYLLWPIFTKIQILPPDLILPQVVSGSRLAEENDEMKLQRIGPELDIRKEFKG